MRHLKKGRKFGRETGVRHALMKSLAAAFFLKSRIQTTEAKAKELRPYVEQFITRAKEPTIANRRLLAKYFTDAVVRRIFTHGSAMQSRKGGYTRIIKINPRKSDSARMAVLELVK